MDAFQHMNAGFAQMQHQIDGLRVNLYKTHDAVKIIEEYVCPKKVTILQEDILEQAQLNSFNEPHLQPSMKHQHLPTLEVF